MARDFELAHCGFNNVKGLRLREVSDREDVSFMMSRTKKFMISQPY
jgi:hypothetical protein